jgi:glycosyltransferase involved in cell wall biosynthesis
MTPLGHRVLICRANAIAPDPRVVKEARALADAGYDVVALGWDRSTKLPVQEQADSYQIYRLPIRAADAHGLGNFPHLLRWQWGLWRWLVAHRNEYDLIHACDFDTVLPALWCQRFYGKLVVYDIFDFYAEMLRATPRVVKQGIRWLDFRAIHMVDATIIADDSRREQIAGSKPRRLTVINNCLDDLQPHSENPSPACAANDHLRLAYFGNLQVERGLLVLLDVLRCHPEWSLDLGGFGPDEAQIRSAAQFPGVTWHGLLPYERVLELSAAADILIAIYDPSIPNNRYSSPNKLFEAMMLGKPIVVAQGTNMDRIVLEWDCGVAIPYGDPAALEDALLRYHQEPDWRRHQGQNSRQAFEQTYNWSVMQKRLLALYSELDQLN